MKKLLFLLILGLTFGLGYWVGQNPDEAKHLFREYSGDVLEKTIGLEESLALRREYLSAKERLVEGKAHLLDREYDKAALELGETLYHLEGMLEADSGTLSEAQMDELMEQVRIAQQRLEKGKGISRQAWNLMQQKLDDLVP